MIALLLVPAWGGSCDLAALTALADGLPDDAGTSAVAPALAKACPRPVGWVRALKAPDDPLADQQAATGQVTAWTAACADGLAALPSGFDPASPGDRLKLWDRCGLDALGLFDPSEWMAAKGPPVTTILAAHVLAREGLPLSPRRRLVRALAGIGPAPAPLPSGVTTLGAVDPAEEDTSPPTAVLLADVPWPPNTDPSVECVVRVSIIEDGTPGRVEWVRCPEELRDYVGSALEASWFQVGRKGGQPVPAVVQLSFSPRR